MSIKITFRLVILAILALAVVTTMWLLVAGNKGVPAPMAMPDFEAAIESVTKECKLRIVEHRTEALDAARQPLLRQVLSQFTARNRQSLKLGTADSAIAHHYTLSNGFGHCRLTAYAISNGVYAVEISAGDPQLYVNLTKSIRIACPNVNVVIKKG